MWMIIKKKIKTLLDTLNWVIKNDDNGNFSSTIHSSTFNSFFTFRFEYWHLLDYKDGFHFLYHANCKLLPTAKVGTTEIFLTTGFKCPCGKVPPEFVKNYFKGVLTLNGR